jgi:hypothetical protein
MVDPDRRRRSTGGRAAGCTSRRCLPERTLSPARSCRAWRCGWRRSWSSGLPHPGNSSLCFGTGGAAHGGGRGGLLKA